MRPAPLALLIQIAAFGLAFAAWRAGVGAWWWQPIIAVALGIALRQPRWWWLIHALFLPLAMLLRPLPVPAWAWALALLLAFGVFGRVDRSRVPLFLSGNAALDALEPLLPAEGELIDLGAGVGTVLARFGTRPGLRVTGVEHAWLPWLLGWLRLRLAGNPARLLRGALEDVDLGRADVVYAFLSPAMMPALWAQARAGMRPGALLVSHCFDVPGVPPTRVIDVPGGRGPLLVWRM